MPFEMQEKRKRAAPKVVDHLDELRQLTDRVLMHAKEGKKSPITDYEDWGKFREIEAHAEKIRNIIVQHMAKRPSGTGL